MIVNRVSIGKYMTKPTTTSDWQKDFHQRFRFLNADDDQIYIKMPKDMGFRVAGLDDIEEYIQSLLDSQKREIIDEFKLMLAGNKATDDHPGEITFEDIDKAFRDVDIIKSQLQRGCLPPTQEEKK